MRAPHRHRIPTILLALVLAMIPLLTAKPARALGDKGHRPQERAASTTFTTIGQGTPTAPLQVNVGTDASYQVFYNYNNGSPLAGNGQFYSPFGSLADAGTFLWVGGQLYGPDLGAHNITSTCAFDMAATPYTELNQTRTGNGTATAPYQVTTRVIAGSIELAETVTLVDGEPFYLISRALTNTSGSATTVTVFHAADLYLNGSDNGYGYYDPESHSVGGYNQGRNRYEVFTPPDPPTRYEEAGYCDIWEQISPNLGPENGLTNTIVAGQFIDNGIALRWDRSLNPGQTSTVRDFHSFGVIPTRGYALPYPEGQRWSVSQGNSGEVCPGACYGGGDHVGSQQYAWDFRLPLGSVVVAARGGRVVAVQDDYPDHQGGCDQSCINQVNYVVIEHDDGTTQALYLHLKFHGARPFVRVGQEVCQGQPIAYSGNSGWSTGPHLHFQVEYTSGSSAFTYSLPITFADVASNGGVPVASPPAPSPSDVAYASGNRNECGSMGWSSWASQGGVLTDAPAAASLGGRVYVFAKGSDHALYVKSADAGGTFTGWQDLGGALTAAPAAASFDGRLYAFAKGSDNALYVKSSADGVTWTTWRSQGGILLAPPAAASVGGKLFVFAKGTDAALYVKSTADGVNWSSWQRLGGVLTAAPAAAGFQNRVYAFAKGSDNALYAMYSVDGAHWTGWQRYGGVLTAAPAATSFTPTGGVETLYTLAKGTDNALYERHTTDGTTWTTWQSLGGQLLGPPAAAGANGRLYAFVWWTDNTLWVIHTLP